VPRAAIVKSLALFADGRPVLALVPGDLRLDQARLARAAGAPRRRVRLATADECVRVFGYVPGTFPPLGLREDGDEAIRVFAAAEIEARACAAPASAPPP
jgi:prolyl-tRNA editing enzyme YbaK/EbsC (Cys-tRNA(Pro) deacylase)